MAALALLPILVALLLLYLLFANSLSTRRYEATTSAYDAASRFTAATAAARD